MTLRHHGPRDALGHLDALAGIYAAIYGAMLGDPFRSVARYRKRLLDYLSLPRFDLVIASNAHGEMAGYGLGYGLTATSPWWERVTPPLPDEYKREYPGRTWVLEELMILPACRGEGVAHIVYHEILGDRPEERATLLIGQRNERAQSQARHWGWQCVGQQRPEPDAPLFDTMVRMLPAGAI